MCHITPTNGFIHDCFCKANDPNSNDSFFRSQTFNFEEKKFVKLTQIIRILEKQSSSLLFSNFTKFLQLQIFGSYFIKLSTFSSLLLLSPEKGWTNGWGFEVLNHSAGAFKKVVLGHTSIMDRFVTMITIIIGNYQFFPKKGVFVTLVLEHGEASKDADIRILFEVRNASILGPAFGGQIFNSKIICTYFKIKDGEIVLIQLIQFKLL